MYHYQYLTYIYDTKKTIIFNKQVCQTCFQCKNSSISIKTEVYVLFEGI